MTHSIHFQPIAFRCTMAMFVVLAVSHMADAATVVNVGSVSQFTGPADLNLNQGSPGFTSQVIYAVNFSGDPNTHTVNGVTFLADDPAPTGTSFVIPNNVTPWQTKPEFGATADDNALEDVMADIRWATNPGTVQANFDVTAGKQYRLQILISANRDENRVWDIQVDGVDAVDEITSLGLSGTTYDISRSTLYEYEFLAPDSQVNVEMGTLFGANDGGDRNPIWQGIILSELTFDPNAVPEPSTFVLLGLGTIGLIGRVRRRRRAA